MARPRDSDKKMELAQRAAAVLEREGLSIAAEQLARELGVKRPTLLYHFPTYGHILEAALRELLTEQLAFVEQRVSAHEHPLDKLFARLQAVHAFQKGREAHVLFLSQAIAATGGARIAEILRAAAGVFEGQRQTITAQLEDGIRRGQVRPCSAAALVSLVRAIIDGVTVQRVTDSAVAPEVIHRFVWEHVLLPLKIEAQAPARTKAPRSRKTVR